MWFTSDGLEQATHPAVAAHRAARLARHLASGAAVVDLCCGIGSDLAAAAQVGLRATGVELDPLTAAMAAATWATRRGDPGGRADPRHRRGRGVRRPGAAR